MRTNNTTTTTATTTTTVAAVVVVVVAVAAGTVAVVVVVVIVGGIVVAAAPPAEAAAPAEAKVGVPRAEAAAAVMAVCQTEVHPVVAHVVLEPMRVLHQLARTALMAASLARGQQFARSVLPART